jgi:hypothetical protein
MASIYSLSLLVYSGQQTAAGDGGARSGSWAGNGLTGGLEDGLAGGLLDFFCFLSINRGGRSMMPALVNSLTEADGQAPPLRPD